MRGQSDGSIVTHLRRSSKSNQIYHSSLRCRHAVSLLGLVAALAVLTLTSMLLSQECIAWIAGLSMRRSTPLFGLQAIQLYNLECFDAIYSIRISPLLLRMDLTSSYPRISSIAALEISCPEAMYAS